MRRAAVAFVLLSALLGSGCRSHSGPGELSMRCEVAPQPPRVGPATVAVTLTGAAGARVNGARVRIEGDMAHPGMGPVFADARQVGPGLYSGVLDFTMPGDWALVVHAALPDGGQLEKQVNVKGVEAR